MPWDQAFVCFGADPVLHNEKEIKALKVSNSLADCSQGRTS